MEPKIILLLLLTLTGCAGPRIGRNVVSVEKIIRSPDGTVTVINLRSDNSTLSETVGAITKGAVEGLK